MSASLVGSEMCIRDRFIAGVCFVAAYPGGCFMAAQIKCLLHGSFSRCLLRGSSIRVSAARQLVSCISFMTARFGCLLRGSSN
eukprot:9167555-Alexandrium_andersonii.AAC.1